VPHRRGERVCWWRVFGVPLQNENETREEKKMNDEGEMERE
jgi:hypothetical protein